jgi:hypothetical protein
MLFQPPDAPKPRRLQGAYVSDEELDRLIAFWQDSPWAAPPRLPPWDDLIPPDDPEEALYEDAVAVALAVSRVSASLLQRRLRIGYGKARALLDRMRREELVDDQGRPDRGPDPEPPPTPVRQSPPPKQAQTPLPKQDPPPSPTPSQSPSQQSSPTQSSPPPRSARPSPPPPPEVDPIDEVEIDESDLLMEKPGESDVPGGDDAGDVGSNVGSDDSGDDSGDHDDDGDDEDLSWVDVEFNA